MVPEPTSGVRRFRWIVAFVLPVLSILVAVVLTASQQPVYRSSTMLAVVPGPELQDGGEIMDALETLERRTIVATFARAAEARRTRAAAAAELGWDPADARRNRLRAVVVPSTNIIRIEVTGPDAERAAALANAAATVAAEEARRMYRIFALTPLETAIPAYTPDHPDPARNYAIAALIGAFLGILAFVALSRTARRGGAE